MRLIKALNWDVIWTAAYIVVAAAALGLLLYSDISTGPAWPR